MVQPPPQNPFDVAQFIEIFLDDNQSPTPDLVELRVTDTVRLRVPADIEPALIERVVDAICTC